MLLVMDVGNSHTVLGLFEGKTLRAHWRTSTTNHRTVDELRILFSMLLHQEGVDLKSITGCCISSVVPQLNTVLQQVGVETFGTIPLMVGPGIKTGLVLHVDNPKEIGADRIVNMVAAAEEHRGPLIIVDFGTATTIDVLTGDAEYKGGAIFPGLQLAADALFERCAKLPRVEIMKPATIIGRDTVAQIQSGLTYGYADLVDGLIARMSDEIQMSPTVIATGGLANIVTEVSRRIDYTDPDLTLKGLSIIYRKNERTPS